MVNGINNYLGFICSVFFKIFAIIQYALGVYHFQFHQNRYRRLSSPPLIEKAPEYVEFLLKVVWQGSHPVFNYGKFNLTDFVSIVVLTCSMRV
jgi:hypothetical protein